MNLIVMQKSPETLKETQALDLVHTSPEKFKNAALFLRLGLPSTLIRHENGALFLRLGLPSTLIRHQNAALFPVPQPAPPRPANS